MQQTMKLLLLRNSYSSSLLLKRRHLSPDIFRVSFYYSTRTQTQTQTQIPSPSSAADNLYARLSLNPNPKISIIPILDKWVSEGQPIEKEELVKTIRVFRKYRRFKHALEVSEWMNEREYFDLSPGDVAVRLDLISKVHGIDQAETYFNSLPDILRVSQVYGALLNSYVDAKSLDKAEVIMQKMTDMDSATTLAYNGMLNLYSHLGKHEKLHSLMQEMEDKGIGYNRYSYSILLNACATSSDIKGMEKLMMKMEMDPLVSVGFHAYAIMAKGYLKFDNTEKALTVLKKAEQLIQNHERRFAYELLLTMYGNMKKKNEVYRLWDLIKKLGKLPNTSYLCMLSSLEKVDDLDGASTILEEWEGKTVHFDIRIPNYLIGAYCNKGIIEKAEVILNRLIKGGKEPNGGTYSRMALGLCKGGKMERAVEMMKKAVVSSSHKGWTPHLPTLSSCLDYLKQNGDSNQAEEIMKLLEESQLSLGSKKRLFWYLNNENGTLDNTEGAV